MSAHIHRMVSLSHPMHWVMTHLHWVLSHSLHIHWMHWMVSHLPWIKSSTITSISSSSLLMMSSLMSHIYFMTILITTSALHLSSIKLPIVISWSIASRFSRVRPPLSMHIHFLKLSLLIRVKFKLISHHLWSVAVTLALSSPLALSVPLVARTAINDPGIAIANRMFPWLSFIGTIVIARIIHLNLRSPWYFILFCVELRTHVVWLYFDRHFIILGNRKTCRLLHDHLGVRKTLRSYIFQSLRHEINMLIQRKRDLWILILVC